MRRFPIIASALLLGASLAVLNSEASSQNWRQLLLHEAVSPQLGGGTTRPLVANNAFTFLAPNAPREHQRPFSFGNRIFNTNWVMAPGSVQAFDGLGPMFNRVSCSGCHTKDGRGAPNADGMGPMDSMLLRISVPGQGAHGGPNPVPGYGDQLSERALPGIAPEGTLEITYEELPGTYGDGAAYSLRKPSYTVRDPGYGLMPADMMMSPRVAPHVIGLGLLEAVPEDILLALADPDDADGDGISGRVNRVWNTATNAPAIGRFGWKAGQPDLLNQNTGAAVGDIGLTTTVHPDENCAQGQVLCVAAKTGGSPEIKPDFIEKLTLYTQTLAVPAQRGAGKPEVKRGAEVFRAAGCAACHMPTLKTAAAALPELSNQTFHPYTDLLLHDMGEGLADNRPEFLATGNEWRTPPLWGLGLVPMVNGHDTLLHDGRARGFAEAILWHGGEGEKAKEAFRTAPKADRDALVAFLNSL
ncbi:MAG: c-type cytochrome [Proteobacteria bacterium]|nr:c-type cytochrome [Pseudomonadota bacterium]